MAEVRKYEVRPSTEHNPNGMCLPEGARFLHVGAQQLAPYECHRVFIWALVDPFRASGACRWISYYATGEPIPPNARYIGTAVIDAASLVWHVFEEATK